MKKFPVLSILYYGFTIIIGIIMAFYWFAFGKQLKATNELTTRVSNGNSEGVVSLLNGYYNNKAVDTFVIEGIGNLDVYEVVTTYTYKVSENDTTNSYTLLEKGYMGIIYNVSDSWDRSSYQNADGQTFNKFGIKFNGLDSNGAETSYTFRIGYDASDTSINSSEADEIQNRYSTYQACGFYYFMLGDRAYKSISSVSSIDFLNAKEEVVASQSLTTSYTLNSTFFEVANTLVSGYNELVLANNATNDNVNSLLETFNQEFNKYDNFKSSDYSTVVKNVYVFSTLKLIAYILVVLILGDFLVGKHRIIHLFQNLFGKKKSKFEEIEDTIYTKHELNTTFEANVPEGYSKTITIKYVNEEQDEICYNLTKENSYKETKLINSGNYIRPVILADGVKCVDIPSELKINGLKFSVKFVFESNEKTEEK